MINANMRLYDYFTFGEDNGYGSPQLSSDVKGTVKMAISISSQAVQENIKYKGATYVGLTHDNVKDNFVISYKGEKLKVLYVNPEGRYNQVFMCEM